MSQGVPQTSVRFFTRKREVNEVIKQHYSCRRKRGLQKDKIEMRAESRGSLGGDEARATPSYRQN